MPLAARRAHPVLRIGPAALTDMQRDAVAHRTTVAPSRTRSVRGRDKDMTHGPHFKKRTGSPHAARARAPCRRAQPCQAPRACSCASKFFEIALPSSSTSSKLMRSRELLLGSTDHLRCDLRKVARPPSSVTARSGLRLVLLARSECVSLGAGFARRRRSSVATSDVRRFFAELGIGVRRTPALDRAAVSRAVGWNVTPDARRAFFAALLFRAVPFAVTPPRSGVSGAIDRRLFLRAALFSAPSASRSARFFSCAMSYLISCSSCRSAPST
mmetsp:Transcript_2084/g.5364  ORF Transcript_2084/g.5364 Transcript_2084/m.5364 type:complete len:271 (-) Transcript_2084:71-883(-)